MQIGCEVELGVALHRGDVVIELGQKDGANMGRETISLVRLVDEAISQAVRQHGAMDDKDQRDLAMLRLAMDLCRARITTAAQRAKEAAQVG